MMIDTHCHLNKEYYDNINEIINNMQDNIMIVSSATLDDLDEIIHLCENHKNIYGTIGIHPEYADTYTKDHLNKIEKYLTHPKIVALGEIGLDYHYTKDNKEKQQKLFIKQIQLANKYHKPLVIHTRDAIQDTYNIIKQYKDTNLKLSLHCYSGSLEMAQELIKQNAYLGIGGVLTFKNEKKLKTIVKETNLNHLILETDSPYLTPEPLRGHKNEPKNIKLVANKIAEIKNTTIDEVFEITTSNAKKIFDIK